MRFHSGRDRWVKNKALMLLFLTLAVTLDGCGVQNNPADPASQNEAEPQSAITGQAGQAQEAFMRNGRDIPQELETIPDAYKRPGEQEGTLIRLTYDTWESFSYEQHS